MIDDASNGYEAVAHAYIAGRGTRPRTGEAIGVRCVRAWADTLARGATVLDLGCGPGEPVSRVLRDAGLRVYGVDASPAMVAAFRKGFPEARVECGAVEASRFFDRTFDGIIAWGLLFLLDASTQELVIGKVGRALAPGGRFLFTAPKQPASWLDAMTGRRSESLGAEVYERLLRTAGMRLMGNDEDEGQSYYYLARTRGTGTVPGSPSTD